jgi:hypothetical protein
VVLHHGCSNIPGVVSTCTSLTCNPYILYQWLCLQWWPFSAGAERVCFTLHTTTDANTTAPCYQKLAANLHKIAFETSYSCFDDRAFYNVTVNGASQHFDVSVQCVRQENHVAISILHLPTCLTVPTELYVAAYVLFLSLISCWSSEDALTSACVPLLHALAHLCKCHGCSWLCCPTSTVCPAVPVLPEQQGRCYLPHWPSDPQLRVC